MLHMAVNDKAKQTHIHNSRNIICDNNVMIFNTEVLITC